MSRRCPAGSRGGGGLMSAYETEGIILMRRGVEVLEQIRDSLVTEPCPDCARAKKIAASASADCILPDDHDGPREIQEGLLS